jgi:hypothetical protein
MKEDEVLLKICTLIDSEKKLGIAELLESSLTKEKTEVRYYLRIMRNLLIGIYTLCTKNNVLYYPAYVLGKTIVECYIDGLFILKEDTDNRRQELIRACDEKREPFKGKKWSKYDTIAKRAYSVGLNDFYESYKDFCCFAHPNVRSYHLFDPNNKKAQEDRPFFIKHMLGVYSDYLIKIGEKFNIDYPREYKDKLKELADDK